MVRVVSTTLSLRRRLASASPQYLPKQSFRLHCREKRLRATSGPAGGEATFLRRLQEFISRTPPPSILGQRGGWSAFVRWDADEISAANRMASARNENLTAIATAGRADDLTGGNAAAALQRMRVVQATPVAAADRSMNVYAPNGRLEMSAFKNL